MAGAGFVDAAAIQQFFDPVAQIRWGDAGAVATEEEGGLIRKVGEEGPGFCEEFVHPRVRTCANWKAAKIPALAATDGEGVGGGIVVAEVELTEFGAADAGGVEEFKHGAVAQAEGLGGVGNGEK